MDSLPCPDRTHSPRLFGRQWVCPDCTPALCCAADDCTEMLRTAHHAKALLPDEWLCAEHRRLDLPRQRHRPNEGTHNEPRPM